MPGAVVPLSSPGASAAAAAAVDGGSTAAARQQRVHAGHEVAVTRAVLRGRRRGRLGLRGGRGSVQAGRGGAQEAGRVGELVRAAVLRLDGQRGAAVGSGYVGSPLPLPPEVAVVEHLLTVRVQRPVVSFTWRATTEKGGLINMDVSPAHQQI